MGRRTSFLPLINRSRYSRRRRRTPARSLPKLGSKQQRRQSSVKTSSKSKANKSIPRPLISKSSKSKPLPARKRTTACWQRASCLTKYVRAACILTASLIDLFKLRMISRKLKIVSSSLNAITLRCSTKWQNAKGESVQHVPGLPAGVQCRLHDRQTAC